jgi:hypothetical protein
MAIIMVVREKTTAPSRVTKLKAGTTAITTRAKVKIVVVMAIITKPKAKVMVDMEIITSIVTIIVGTINTIGAMVINMVVIITKTGVMATVGPITDPTVIIDLTLMDMGTDHMLITHSPTIHMYLLR